MPTGVDFQDAVFIVQQRARPVITAGTGKLTARRKPSWCSAASRGTTTSPEQTVTVTNTGTTPLVHQQR